MWREDKGIIPTPDVSEMRRKIMYRILLQTKAAAPNSPANYQFLMDKNVVWETADSTEALKRYEAELDNYKKSVMTLVKIIDVDLNPTTDDCVCAPDCECPSSTPVDPENPTEPTDPVNPGEGTDPTPEVTE